MVSFWINYGTNYIGGTTLETQSNAAWLVPICLQLVPAFVLLIGMIWMPFSPRWLMHHGREEEARKNLASLRDLPEDHELIELEFLEIKAQSLFEKRSIAEAFPHLSEQTTWNTFKLQFVAIGALFKTKAMFKRVIVATVTMFFQQWSGINAVRNASRTALSLASTTRSYPLMSPGPLLRPPNLHPTRSSRKYELPPRHRRRRHRNVPRHYPRSPVHRPSRPQTRPRSGRNRHGDLTHCHRRHPRQEHKPLRRRTGCRLGRRGNGLALRDSLWVFLGSVCLDPYSGDLAPFHATLWHGVGRQ
jgi:hypothetical protein